MKKIVLSLFVVLIALLLTSCTTIGVTTHKVTFTTPLGPTVARVKHGDKLQPNQIPDTQLAGYLFNGWYFVVNEAEYVFDVNTPIRNDYNLNAKYSAQIEDGEILIRVYGLNLSLLLEETIPVNSSYLITYNTTLAGYVFVGWFYDSNYTIPYTVSTLSTTTNIYGQWLVTGSQDLYTVNFYGPTGQVFSTSQVISGNKINAPTSTYVAGYVFMNWYTTSAFTTVFNFNLAITSNTNIYGRWLVSDGEGHYPYTGTYYNSIDVTNINAVKTLITVNPSSYEQAKTTLAYSDRDPANPSNVLTVYSRTSVQGPWSSGGTIWNREHVFPNSKCGYQLGSGTPSEHDTHNLKPALASENGSRGNKSYGPGSGAFGSVGSYFWPGDIDKGDVARIIMYMSLRWGLVVDGPNGSFSSVALMLQWHNEDPVDAFEMQRNDGIAQYQGNRNPFIDHPELAFIKWSNPTSKAMTFNVFENRGLSLYEKIHLNY
ncbi:MAG: endonuclease [Acholeplasmatales bacterium]|jgi:endonuclease I|nr:endonuclease [Acholeplasmatales bacterium]